LGFELNQGQTNETVKVIARTAEYTLFITAEEAVFAGRDGSVERMKLLGANRKTHVEPLEKQLGITNYFIGNDPSKWRTNVPHYGRVELREVYPGIDLIFYSNERQIEYDWVLAPGADPRQIRTKWEGADRISKNAAGDLVLTAALRQVRPVILQDGKPVAGGYVVRGNEVGFEIAAYDRTKPLLIDPMFIYSTYLGGSGNDSGVGIAADSTGNAYVTGVTFSTDFPTGHPLQTPPSSATVFVTKINSSGSALVYSTFLGGSGDDFSTGIAVDNAGNAYVTGYTNSANFPSSNPLQASIGGSAGNDAFVTKLDPSGSSLIYSTFLGGTGDDFGGGIAVDSSGYAYVTGYTYSINFPTKNPLQTAPLPLLRQKAFVAKITPAGSALVYSTYLGGDGLDEGHSIAVDSGGNAYVTGLTSSTNFPMSNPLQATYAGGSSTNGFVTKINMAGSALVYSTYLGGNNQDGGYGIAVDSAGNAYVTGFVHSTNFPTSNPLQPTQGSHGVYPNAFVAKFNASGSALVYSTFLGGNGRDVGNGIAVDSAGNAYVTGSTDRSFNFPVSNPLQAFGDSSQAVFVTEISASGSSLVYSTYLGNGGGTAIAVDTAGNAYVTGTTGSVSFPTSDPLQDTLGAPIGSSGLVDAFISVIGPGTPPNLAITTAPVLSQGSLGPQYSKRLSAVGGLLPYRWSLVSGSLPSGLLVDILGLIRGTPLTAGTSTFTLRVDDAASSFATRTFSITIVPPLAITTNPALPSGMSGVFYSQSLGASGGSPPYAWTLISGALPSGLSLSSTGGITGIPLVAGTSNFTARVTDSASVSATQTFSLTTGSGLTITTSVGLPAGTVGTFYSQDLTASGGLPPYSWSLISGTIPSGLSLSNVGSITGTPTAAGILAFAAKVTDAALTSVTQSFILSIGSSNLSLIGSMSHIAAEENWTTAFTIVNKGNSSARAQLSLFGDVNDPSGYGPLVLPLTFPQQAASPGPIVTDSFDQAIPANASLIINTAGAQSPPVLVGSAQLASSGTVDGFAIFHQIVTNQEAVVPVETRNASSYLLAFDNMNGLELGVALENISAQNAVIGIVIRDDTGAVISAPGASISLPGNGHTSFVLSDPIMGFPVTGNKRGTIEFDTPAGGRISVLGLRFTPPNNALTTIPALANIGTSGGSIAHLASGGDGWQTTFVLVNTGTSTAQATLSFFADQTGAPLPLPLSFPQGNISNRTAPSVTPSLAAGATLVIVSAGAPNLLTGSAQLSTTGHVSGFVIFRHNGQEAVVPLESRNANAYIVAFDNTAGTATGVAVNAVSAQPVNIPITVRDDAGAIIATDAIAMAANGHFAFTLGTDRYPGALTIRGTIEFDTPAGAQIGALGIRIPTSAAHTYTTLPALAK